MGGLSIATDDVAALLGIGAPGLVHDPTNADGLFPLPCGERARVRGLQLRSLAPLTPTLSAALPPPQGRGSQTEFVGGSSSTKLEAANGGAVLCVTVLARYTSTVA